MKCEFGSICLVNINITIRTLYVLFTDLILRYLDQQIGLMLNRDLQLSYRDFGQGLLSSCNQNAKLADIPIQVRYRFSNI